VLDVTIHPPWTFHLYTSLPITIFLVLGSSFSRIYLGVHYPSDCFFAVIQALIAISIGLGGYYIQKLFCYSCYDNSCYGINDMITLRENVYHVNWYLFSIASVAWLIVAVLCSVKPLQFYVKFHHVFGILLPCLTFQLVFLCRGLSLNGRSALGAPQDAKQWYSWVFGIIFTGLMTIIGMKSRKDKLTDGQLSSVITFVIVYSVSLTVLILWRGYYV
jgi:membrane-associated phospholipid phosphatase